MENPLHYKDLLIPDTSISDAIKQLEQLKVAYTDMLNKITDAAKSQKEALEKVTVVTKEQQEEVKKSSSEAEKLIQQQKLYDKALEGTVSELDKLKKATQEQQRINKLTEQLNRSEKGSYNALAAQFGLNMIALNKMSEAQRKGTLEGKAFEAETKKIYTEMKQLQKDAGATTLNVGNYADALGKIPGPVGAAASGVATLGKSFMSLIANPIIATIAAIAAGIYVLYESMTRTEEGQNKLNKVMLEGKAVFNWVADSVTKLAISIFDLSDNTKDYTEKVKDVGTAWFEVWKKTNPALIAFKALFGETDTSLKKAIDDARILGKLIEEDQKYDRKRELENSELVLKSNKLRADATELRKTDAKAGLKMMIESYDIDKKIAENNVKEAKDKAIIAQYEFNISKKDTEALDKLNRAKIAVNEAEGAYDEQRIGRARKINAMRSEDQKQEEARLAVQLKINQLGKDDTIRVNGEILSSTKTTYEQKSKALEENANIEYFNLKKIEDVSLKELENKRSIKLISEKDYQQEKLLITKKFTDDQTAVAEKYWTDQEKLDDTNKTDQIARRQKDAELSLATVKNGSEQELDLKLNLLQISREKELIANSLLKKDLQQSEKKINESYDKQSLDMTNKFFIEKSLLEFDNQQLLNQSQFDLLVTTEEEKTRFRLKAERDRLEEILKLNINASEKLSDVQVLTMKNVILKINEEIAKSLKKEKPKDIYDLIGLNISDQKKQGIQDSTQFAIGQVNDLMNSVVQSSQASVQAKQQEVDATKTTLDKEIEARNNGYASNVEGARREFEEAKKNQQKAIDEQRKAQKAQQAIQTIEQTGNLITASSKIWSELGFPLALPALAIMWASFMSAKIKASQVSKTTFGKGGYEVLKGGSHESGNDIPLGTMSDGTQRTVEGEESLGIFTKASTRKYRRLLPDVVNSINKGTFENKYLNAFNHSANVIVHTDMSTLEKDVKGIREQGDKPRYFVDSKGRTIRQYKNLTQIIS